MTPKQVVKYFGNGDILATARAIGYTYPGVKRWVDTGVVPSKAQASLQAITGGALKADKREGTR